MLDFSQMGPRIIYGMAGMPFIGDAYAVPSLLKHRSLVKQVFGAMTHVGSRFNRLEDISSPLPDGMSMSRVCKAIEDHNTPIADYFYRRAGMEAMRVESNIIVDILLALRDKGVVALPVHDALVVREDLADEAEAAMLAMFKLHTGLEGLVTVE
ncbi:hypothetical protein [Cupriavidus sp. D39]|uniref:hypothetical protein n=1 Tax=Cupriavidus sp. D39 TaxID=2997877 RepID=UPI00227197E7|nr:hypothetical protein [Cupriavidus sp. D39]MCY0856437.1 hypothetical protein [Cupriavidus sp. D39]